MENKTSPKMKYCIYCRKSTESEDRQVLSIDSQTDKAKEIADRLGVRISDKDLLNESKSAKITANRPKFREMIDRIESGERNGIIVWHADRLSRNAIDSALLIDLMDREKLVEIITPTQTFKNTPIDKFMFSLMCNQAKMENDKKGVDVKRGLDKKASMGIFPNQPPFGYTNNKYAEKDNKTIESDTERLPLLRKMVDLMLTGNYTPTKIREIATNEWSFKTPKGKKIGKSTVYRFFTNTFYYGMYEYPLKSGNWYKGIHEPLITKELFDLVQQQVKSQIIRVQDKEFAFTKLMACGLCGSGICADEKFKKQKNGNIHRYVYYGCTKAKDKNCKCGYIEEKELIKQIQSLLEKLNIDEIEIKYQIKVNIEQFTKMQKFFLGVKEKVDISSVEIGSYAKYILQEGENVQKRELLGCLKSKILLKEKKIYL